MSRKLLKGIKQVAESGLSAETGYLYLIEKEEGKGYVQLDGKKYGKYNAATTSSDGLLSSADKLKLDSVESGAQENNIFIAEYDRTTYREIIEAYGSGKVVYLDRNDLDHNYKLTEVLETGDNSTILGFCGIFTDSYDLTTNLCVSWYEIPDSYLDYTIDLSRAFKELYSPILVEDDIASIAEIDALFGGGGGGSSSSEGGDTPTSYGVISLSRLFADLIEGGTGSYELTDDMYWENETLTNLIAGDTRIEDGGEHILITNVLSNIDSVARIQFEYNDHLYTLDIYSNDTYTVVSINTI